MSTLEEAEIDRLNAEIERLQAAKRAALKIADARVKENVELRAEIARLRVELKEARGERS